MVKFGDPNIEIKRDDPERRKSFRIIATQIQQISLDIGNRN